MSHPSCLAIASRRFESYCQSTMFVDLAQFAEIPAAYNRPTKKHNS